MQFDHSASAARQAQKILRRQIRKALDSLDVRRIGDEDIHRARRQIKMARATLRLLREGLSRNQYRTANRCLRKAARPLGMARDATALRGAFAQVRAEAGARHRMQRAGSMEHVLARDAERARRRVRGRHGAHESRRLLRRTRKAAGHWHPGHRNWALIGAGLGRIYGAGRAGFALLHRAPTDDAFHAWRKQAKYLRHQLDLLQQVDPARICPLLEDLHTLSDLLGDDHDLTVLRGRLCQAAAEHSGQVPLLAALERRSQRLRRRALRLGGRLYAEPPAAFCAQLHRHWREWRRADHSGAH